jgi:hypothetical protein
VRGRCALHTRIRGSVAAAMGILLGVLLGVAQPGMAGLRTAYREPVGDASRTAQPLIEAASHRVGLPFSQSRSDGTSDDSQSTSDDTTPDSSGDVGRIVAKSAAVHGVSGSGAPGSSSDLGSATHDRADTAAEPDRHARIHFGPDTDRSAGHRGSPAERAPPAGSAA